jgi:hypothetical protein
MPGGGSVKANRPHPASKETAEMSAETLPDPFQDAMGAGLQRAVQVASCAVTAAQVYLYQHRTQAMAAAERDERARRALTAQSRADREAARASWAPALDADWLRRADLFQAARAWGAAMPYADRSMPWYEPAAATAMRKCEDRLRDLHPHAMARYDRLRGDGMGAAEAMRQTAPLFAHAPRAYDRPYVPRAALVAGDGESLAWTAPPPDPGEQSGVTLAEAQELRGKQIVAALQDRARAQRRGPLGESEQRTVLETITNVPPDVIDRVVSPASATVTGGTAATACAATARPGPAARPWEHDFPVPIQDVVATPAPFAPGHPPAASPRVSRRSRSGRHRR